MHTWPAIIRTLSSHKTYYHQPTFAPVSPCSAIICETNLAALALAFVIGKHLPCSSFIVAR